MLRNSVAGSVSSAAKMSGEWAQLTATLDIKRAGIIFGLGRTHDNSGPIVFAAITTYTCISYCLSIVRFMVKQW